MTEAGIEVVAGSDELEAGLRELGQPIADAWLAKAEAMGVDGQEVIDFHLARIAEGDAAMAQ